jgi:hypothetical protein
LFSGLTAIKLGDRLIVCLETKSDHPICNVGDRLKLYRGNYKVDIFIIKAFYAPEKYKNYLPNINCI